VEFDYDKKTVFWSDVATHTIMSAHLDGTNIKVLLIHNPHRDVCRLCSPEGLAYDKVEERLYYTDSAGGEICYIDVASGTQHPVPHPVRFLGSLDSPRAIVIKNRKLYFSEIGNTSTISSVDIAMPTPPPDIVVSKNLTWPNALAISRNGDRLYFGDASEDYIAYYDFQSQKVVRLSSATHVYDMVEYAPSGAPQLLWSDWGDGVVKMLVNTRGVVSLASSNDVHYASGIKVFTEQQ
jgi:integrin beta 2